VFSSSTTPAADIPYIGRFAPSPTGPLHFGSLLAAVASYLDARSNSGKWLIRMEDLDPPREMANAQQRILEALDVYQLHSDEPIVYQSNRYPLYQNALDLLIHNNLVFPCTCSRKQLNTVNGIHFGNCHSDISSPEVEFAWRFNCQSLHSNSDVCFNDALQGQFKQSLQHEIGDFVVKRKDLLWAYQLAMVVDDYQQGVTHVVRGIDLIDSTLRQNMLQKALGYSIPQYAHIPVACAENGQKLSKQNLAPALDLENPVANLWRALSWLRQEPPKKLQSASVKELLAWGIAHWQPLKLQGIQSQSSF
jgi:glutamyl-Q tRNA(Asp) synthetase